MNIYFCSFATKSHEKYQIRQKSYLESTAQNSINYRAYNTGFLTQERISGIDLRIISSARGFGYWFWKPLILLDMIENSNKNDIIIYSDAEDIIHGNLLNKLTYYDDLLTGYWDCILLSGSFAHNQWTHAKCFELMGCNSEKFINDNIIQIEAGFQIYKNNSFIKYILQEYKYWCQIYDVVADNSEINCNLMEHRHDQSILTNLALKYNLNQSNNIKIFNVRDFVECNFSGW